MVQHLDSLRPTAAAGTGEPPECRSVDDLWNDEHASQAMVVALRCLCSSYLKHHKDGFLPYLDGYDNIDDFCRVEVDPMRKDADNLQVIALASYYQVPALISYLDQSPGDECTVHKFPEDCEAP